MICPNCQRDMTARDCALLEHRQAYATFLGRDLENVVGSKVGKSHCLECDRWLDNDHFWSRTRKCATKKCGGCLRKRRLARPTKLAKKAKWRRTMAETNHYWEAQAASHQ